MMEWMTGLDITEVKFMNTFLFVVGLVLIAVLIRWIVPILILRRARLSWFTRAIPVLELALWITILLLGIHTLFRDKPIIIMAMSAILLGILLWAARFAIKDLVWGVILRAEEPYRLHDRIRFNKVDGWISNTGIRSLKITATDGQQIRIPYSCISNSLFAKTTPKTNAYIHTFRIEVPKSESLSVTIESIRIAVLNSIWSSVVNEPSIRYDSEGKGHYILEITINALSNRYFSRIEDKVRRFVREGKHQNSPTKNKTEHAFSRIKHYM